MLNFGIWDTFACKIVLRAFTELELEMGSLGEGKGSGEGNGNGGGPRERV